MQITNIVAAVPLFINRLLLKSNERKLKMDEDDIIRGLMRFLPRLLPIPLPNLLFTILGIYK